MPEITITNEKPKMDLPPGSYVGVVTKIEHKTLKYGDTGWLVWFEVPGVGDSSDLWVFSTTGFYKITAALIAMGLAQPTDTTVKVEEENILGKHVGIKTVERAYNGKMYSKVSEYFKPETETVSDDTPF